MDKNIVEFSLKSTLPLLKKPVESQCRCRRYFLIEHSRLLECRDCGKLVEPFDFVVAESQRQNSVFSAIFRLSREKKELIRQIERLKKDLINIKAKIKRRQTL